MNLKNCSQCDIDLPHSEFYRDRSRADGLQSRCKACSSANSRLYYHANKEKANAANLEWQRNNRDKVNAYKRRARAKASAQATT